MNLKTAEFYLRPIQNADLPEVLAVYTQCEDFLAAGPNPVASMEMVQADRALSDPQGGCYCGIFLPDDALVGILDIIPAGWQADPQCAYLELLMIAAPWRKKQLGTRVTCALENLLRESGVLTLCADVQVNLPNSLTFWKKCGYQLTGGPNPQPDGTVTFSLQKKLG